MNWPYDLPRKVSRRIAILHRWAGNSWGRTRQARRSQRKRAPAQLSVAIKIGIPEQDRQQQHSWGDYHFAQSLRRELTRRAIPCTVQILPDWYDAHADADASLVLHVCGLSRYHPDPSRFNVLWIISHPDQVSDEQLADFDLVAVASEPYARRLSGRTRARVVYLPQFTDPVLFHVDTLRAAPAAAGTAIADEHAGTGNDDTAPTVLFVGNSRRVERPIVAWAASLHQRFPLTVIGRDWEGLNGAPFVRQGFVPYEELGRHYARAFACLNDHWPDMRRHGFINNRILDACAAGAFVVSDDHPELAHRFPLLPRCGSAAELAAILERARDDDAWRQDVIADCRRRVLDLGVERVVTTLVSSLP